MRLGRQGLHVGGVARQLPDGEPLGLAVHHAFDELEAVAGTP